MRTKAIRIHGKHDLRLDEFDLPPIKEDEILAKVVSDSICMSSYKAARQGADHKRVPDDIAIHPTIIGHEFAGELIEVGARWRDQFRPGEKYSIQPALNYKGSLNAPGYSYRYIGGDATHIIIPRDVMEMNCLLPYQGEDYFHASLSEPLSCIIGAFHASYHTMYGSYIHQMDIKEGGTMALLAAAGPMGLGAIDYAINRDSKPGKLVVTDIDQAKLDRASRVHTIEYARTKGVELIYVNTSVMEDPTKHLLSLSDNKGYDDVFVFAPVRQVVEQGDRILGFDGCLNFFAGPEDQQFSASFNFYNVHYAFTHIVGTSGGNIDDMKEALELMAAGRINPAVMVTHIGGLDSVIDTTLRLPDIPGGKKLIYTNISLELTALDELKDKASTDPLFKDLAEIVEENNGIWSKKAEDYLLENGRPI